MAARVSRSLSQLSCRQYGRLPVPTRRPGFLFLTRLNLRPAIVGSPNVARQYATHTNSEPPAQRNQRNQGKDSFNVDVSATRTSSPTQPHWESQDLHTVDRPYEPGFIANFVKFTMHGHLPNGRTSTLPRLHPTEFPLLDEPTAAWAPVDTPGPPPSATSAIYKIMMHCGGNQDPSRLCIVGKNIHFMKARLLDGLVPLSEAQWQEQDLDNPAHLERACEHLSAVAAVFEYLSIEQVRASLRDHFNLISDELGEVQRALNARRRANPEEVDAFSAILDLRALWAEYVPAVYETMTRTAHAWVLAHLARLKARMLDDEMFDTVAVDQTELDTWLARFFVRWDLLARITFQADAGFWMPLEGYKGYRAPTGIVAGLHHPQLKEFAEVYPRRHHEVLSARLQAVPELQTSSTGKDGEVNKVSSALLRLRKYMSTVTVAEDQLRLELRGSLSPPLTELPPALWIQRALRVREETMSGLSEDAGAQTIGFAVYRAAYRNISDEEWEVVRAKVEEQVAAWGIGEPGAEEVKPFLKLRWFDCRDLGIDPKDTQAVRSHFRELRTQHPLLNPLIFLMLDPWGASSYIREDQDELPRDFRPHLLAVDAEFVPSLIPEAVSPGYTGQMRILGNLVWSELYAMSMMQSAQLWDMWPLATEHPQKVYTGAVVPSQIQEWREQKMLKDSMIDSFEKFLQKKDPKAAQAVSEMKEGKYGF